ncbi:MAG: MFS transporter [Ruminiclostridium sp.]|nr:MFS transporter [Ruminiclostridium sp.]
MKQRKIFYGWWVVAGCILITMTMVPPIMALSNKYLLYVTEDLGISRSAFTLANTVLQALGIFLSPFVTRFLAGGNMRVIQSVSILGYCASYFSYSLAQSPIHLYISSLFLGVFYLNATLIPVSMMVTNWFTARRGLAMSLAMAGIGVGGTIFSPVLTFFLESYGWRASYRLMAGIILVVALPAALFLLRKRPEDLGLEPLGGQPAAQAGAGDFHLPLGTFFFWLLLIGMLTNGLINAGALGHFPPAMQESHGPAVQAAVISAYSLISIGGKLILGWVNDRFGVVVSTTYACILFGLSFVFILLSARSVAMLYAMAVVFGLGNAIGTVTPPLLTAEVFGKENYSRAYGIVNSFSQVGLSLGSLAVASVYDAAGSYRFAWVMLLVLTAVTLASWVGAVVLSRRTTSPSGRGGSP